MKITISILLITFFASCQKASTDIPNFQMSDVRDVSIKISPKAKFALEDLSKISVKDDSRCSGNLTKEYNVDFYFKISQDVKELIIIKYFNNPCEDKDGNVNREIRKSIIPIDKIGSVDHQSYDGIYTHTDNQWDNLFIYTSYNSKSINEEYVESRGTKENRNYFQGKTESNCLIIEAPKEFCQKIQKDIEVLKEEFKL